MATPLNIAASTLASHVVQNAGIEMQSRSVAVDSVNDEGAAGVQQQISPGGASQVPSDASQAEKRMLHAIASSLQQGAPAVVDAMVAAWKKENVTAKQSTITKILDAVSSELRELPLSAACAMNQSLAVISELLKVFPVDAQTEDARMALRYAATYNSDVAVVTELLKAVPDSVREKDEDGWLPLDWAAKFNTNFAVFAELLNADHEEDPLEGFDPFSRENPNFTEAVVGEYLSLHPDFAFNKRLSLKACVPALFVTRTHGCARCCRGCGTAIRCGRGSGFVFHRPFQHYFHRPSY